MKYEIPSSIVGFMKKPPLLKDDSLQEYYEFLDCVIAAMEPDDIIDWLWTLRFTDGSWNVQRLVRFRAALINARYKVSLQGVILQTKVPVGIAVTREDYNRKDREAAQEIEQW